MADVQQAAVTGSAPGTIDAALDEYLGQKAAPAPVDNATPSPSEGPGDPNAEPEPQSPDPAPDAPPPAEPAPEPEGGEAEPVAATPELTPGDHIVTMQINGETVEATLDEVRDSWMRQADYTRKTTELSQQRQQAEAYFQQVAGQEAQYAQGIDAIAQALQAQQPPEPDPALQEIDPVAYLEAKEAQRAHQERMSGLANERARVLQSQQQQSTQNMAGQLEQAKHYLVQAMPELQAPEKMKDFVTINRAHLVANGFSEQEASNVYDPRAAIYIDKARRYDEMMAKADGHRVQARTPTSPTIRQSQTAPTPVNQVTSAVKKADAELSRTGSVEAAVDLLIAQRGA